MLSLSNRIVLRRYLSQLATNKKYSQNALLRSVLGCSSSGWTCLSSSSSNLSFNSRSLCTAKSDEQEKKKPAPNKKYQREGPDRVFVTWRSMIISLSFGAIMLGYIWNLQKKKEDEMEKLKRRTLGKSLIGGPWELVNTKTGKLESDKDYNGKWLLIYFGFTHCPDICPDELEKMCTVAKKLEETSDETFEPVTPVFFTVDPDRDTAESVKKYCEEFSPKLIGFTGTKEQVNKVARTFRVYHSEGPRDEFDDYIVDHTVIMYLIDPTGQFIDYYGQNRKPTEIVDAIQMQMLKFARGRSKGWW